MADENNILSGSEGKVTQPQTVQVSVRMQQGEHTGQPIYSNFTTLHSGQGVILVDFGFLDPQAVNALNTMIKSGESVTNTVNAKLSCRMAISIDAAKHLSQQLNQLLSAKAESHGQVNQQNKADSKTETSSSNDTFDNETKQKSEQSGFRFPWSKKTH